VHPQVVEQPDVPAKTWSEMNGLLIVSGAFGVFRRDLLVALGGFSRATLGEDMEMTMRIRDPRGEESAQLLEHLCRADASPRDPRSYHASTGDDRSVSHPDPTADGHAGVGVNLERTHRARDRLALQEAVRVCDDDELTAGDRDAGVDRIGAPTVLLADDTNLGSVLEMLTLRIRAVLSAVLPRSGSGTRSNASSSRANVSSCEPSSTTTTSSGA
jgi:hypothetical protein